MKCYNIMYTIFYATWWVTAQTCWECSGQTSRILVWAWSGQPIDWESSGPWPMTSHNGQSGGGTDCSCRMLRLLQMQKTVIIITIMMHGSVFCIVSSKGVSRSLICCRMTNQSYMCCYCYTVALFLLLALSGNSFTSRSVSGHDVLTTIFRCSLCGATFCCAIIA